MADCEDEIIESTKKYKSKAEWDPIVSYFQIVQLSILSVPTLCLKDSLTRNDTIHPEILLTVGVILWKKVAWLLAIQIQEEVSVNN